MKRVSQDDIAKEVGVSKTVVSYVLNGKAEEKRISDEMIQKVLLKAKEMGYKMNSLARALRTGKSNTIGLVVSDISNSFFGKLARSIENEAWNNGYNVIFGSSDEDSQKSIKLMDVFLDKKVDGLIICHSKGDREYIEELEKTNVPYVLVDRYYKDIESNVIVVDNYKGSGKIVENQIKKGNRRIGYVNFNIGVSNMEGRLAGYKKALASNAIELDEELVKNVTFNDIEELTRQAVFELLHLEEPVDAIYFANNHLASLGVKLIIDHNKKNKAKIEICSFDGFELVNLIDAKMTYGVQSIEKLGENAIELILKQINLKQSTSRGEKRIFPIDIVEIN